MLFGLTGTYKASATAAAGNAESRSPTRDFNLVRSRSRRISHTPTTPRAMFGRTQRRLCASARVFGIVVEFGGWLVGFLALLPGSAARPCKRCVRDWCWPLNDGRKFDGQVCRSEVRRLEIPGGRLMKNILANVLNAEYSGEYSCLAGRYFRVARGGYNKPPRNHSAASIVV